MTDKMIRLEIKGNNVTGLNQLPILYRESGDQFVFYCPSLELISSGDTIKEGRLNLMEAIDLFFEHIIGSGTINEALTDLGWELEHDEDDDSEVFTVHPWMLDSQTNYIHSTYK